MNLKIETSSANIFRLFRINSTNFASILINISVNNNIKISLTKFFRLLSDNNFSVNNNVNLFCNINNNFIFNVETFL